MFLRRRLVLLFASIIAGVLLIGAAGGAVIRQRDETRSTERRLGIAQEQVAELVAAYSDQESGARGFVLSSDERFLEPFNTGTERAERLTRSLRDIARDETAVQRPLSRVVAAADEWRTKAALRAISGRRSGAANESVIAVTDRGKRLFDVLRGDLATLTRRVDDLATAAEDRANRAQLSLALIVVLVVGFAIAGTLVAAWLIRRWVTRPLDALAENVRQTRAGDSEHVIRAVGPPEFAALAGDIEAMRLRIEEQRAEADRSRLALEQSAAVLLTLRAHLEPEVGPLPHGWTFAAQLRAAEGVVAGEGYDIVFLGHDRIGLVVVDIAGHGATEGILALRCKELLRAALSTGFEPGAAIATAADQLGDFGEEVFLTAFVSVIDTGSGHVRYANAGHPPAFIATGEDFVELGPTGPLVGLLGSGWHTAEATVGPADTLCAYTDGLIEARNQLREFFGAERLMDLVQGARCDEAPAVVKRCLDEVQAFAPDGLRDDATIVVVCRPDDD